MSLYIRRLLIQGEIYSVCYCSRGRDGTDESDRFVGNEVKDVLKQEPKV